MVFAARIFATLWRAAADSEAGFEIRRFLEQRLKTPKKQRETNGGCLKVSSLEMVGLHSGNLTPPFEDIFPIQDGDFPLLCLFTGG